MPSPGLIDVHAHFVTDSYTAAARAAGIDHPDGMPGWPEWSAQNHLDLMERTGIDKSYLSLSSPGVHFGDDAQARSLARELNDFAHALHADRPRRFGHFACLPLPDIDGAVAEARYALDVLGADGVVVETNHRGMYLGDRRLDALWQVLDDRAALVFVHPTSPPHAEEVALGRPRPMVEFIFDTARTAADLVFRDVLTSRPRIRWVLTHCGGALPVLADRMEMFHQALATQDQPGVVQQLSQLWYDIAGTPFPHQVPALRAAFGTTRTLYGSDYCWTSADAVERQVRSIDQAPSSATGDTWRELTTANADRLLDPSS
ncbi:amidohydrolase family protein [Streptomyces californicus]|uniref:amidohydrolase family protein n=1 Tax=Streptomyces californicus TaxID=67351 RepID=UPI0037122093